MKKNYFKNLRKLISEKGFTQMEVAKKVGVSNPTLFRWSTGQFCPSFDKLEELCKVLGVTASELIGF